MATSVPLREPIFYQFRETRVGSRQATAQAYRLIPASLPVQRSLSLRANPPSGAVFLGGILPK